jgi:RNA polymerase sigma-70 factor (sigma-E family)
LDVTAASEEGTVRIATHETVAEFARRSGFDLLRFAYLLCGDRSLAEDLLQEVLFAMWRRFPDGITVENPVGYARRALAHRNVSRARRASSSEVVVDLPPLAATPSPTADLGDRDLLWQAIRRLPPRQRTVLVLRYYADATDQDIAAALQCRRGTVRSLASRGLVTMRADAGLSEFEGGAS